MSVPEFTFLVPSSWYSLLIFISFWCCFIPILIVLLYRRRNHPYLKARSVNILIICIAGSGLSIISPSLFSLLGTKYPCWATHIGACFGPYLTWVPDSFRCVRLICMDQVGKYKTKLAIEHLNGTEVALDEKTRSRRNRKIQWMIFFSKSKSLSIIYAILGVVHTIVYFCFILSSPAERSMGRCTTVLVTIETSTFIALYALVTFIMSIFIYKIREEFNIRVGIWNTVTISFFSILGNIIWITLMPQKVSSWFHRSGWFLVGVVLDVINLAIFPLIRSYSSRFQTLQFDRLTAKHEEPMSELKRVLEHPESRSMFFEYCKGEFSSENYYFWLENISFKKKSVLKRYEAAGYMMNKYILEDSPLTLNISASVRQQILTEWDRVENAQNNNNDTSLPEPDFFDAVVAETNRNMLDTYLRFRKCREWVVYRKKLEQEREAYQDLLVEREEDSENKINTDDNTIAIELK